ncbi:MAG: hypothetical protein ABFD69_16990 [Candidatus Sumerlaeia bacterium]
MGNFTYRHVEDTKTMEITLSTGFTPEDQEELMGIVLERANRGVVYWDLNLTQMPTVSSFVIGMMVTMNAVLLSKSGNLRLILGQHSKVASILHLARLDKILRFVYV